MFFSMGRRLQLSNCRPCEPLLRSYLQLVDNPWVLAFVEVTSDRDCHVQIRKASVLDANPIQGYLSSEHQYQQRWYLHQSAAMK